MQNQFEISTRELISAKERVRNKITNKELKDLKEQTSPAQCVQTTLFQVLKCLGERVQNWQDVTKIISRPLQFRELLLDYNASRMTPKELDFIINDQNITEQTLGRHSQVAAVLYGWLQANYRYKKNLQGITQGNPGIVKNNNFVQDEQEEQGHATVRQRKKGKQSEENTFVDQDIGKNRSISPRKSVYHKVKDQKDIEWELRHAITGLQVENDHLKTQLFALNERLDVVDDLREQQIQMQEIRNDQKQLIDNLVKENEHLRTVGNRFQNELVTASDYILQLEERCNNANQNSLDILKKLRDAEIEIEILKNYTIDLKTRISVYIPIKGDPIDTKLAEYINNYPERNKLKIMFMRESLGVYEFGQKRIAVQMLKDKIQVRVGGGYLSIDEFIDQYTPVELDRLEKRDPLKRLNEKVAVQKSLLGRVKHDVSPNRMASVSPLRK